MSSKLEEIKHSAKPVDVDRVMCGIDERLSQNPYVIPNVRHLFPRLASAREFTEIEKFLIHAANYTKHKNDPTFVETTYDWDNISHVRCFIQQCLSHNGCKTPENMLYECTRVITLANALKQGAHYTVSDDESGSDSDVGYCDTCDTSRRSCRCPSRIDAE
jgi:hypothetical protein